LLRWLAAPWRNLSDTVQQISQLQVVLAGHVATLQRLQTALDYDGLTGAHTRLFFFAALRQELARFIRDSHLDKADVFTIGMLDVDRFKSINDRHGHAIGDLLLIRIADEARRILRRDGDVFARLGGDEFALLLPQTSLDGARAIADSLRAAIASLQLPGEPSISVSIGLAECPTDGSQSDMLLHAADCAMYRAKQKRNAVCVAGEP
jgi:diguanylate cyclase (GGDEF)-like protein